MHSSIQVSMGLARINGPWYGAWLRLEVKREIQALVADRKADAALEGQKTDGRPRFLQQEGPPTALNDRLVTTWYKPSPRHSRSSQDERFTG